MTQHAGHQTFGQGSRRSVHSCISARDRPFRIWILTPFFCLSEVAIALRVDKELERGCAQGILQIVGEEVQPGKREQQ